MVPWPAPLVLCGILSERQFLKPSPHQLDQKLWGGAPYFLSSKLSGWFCCMLKFENYCSGIRPKKSYSRKLKREHGGYMASSIYPQIGRKSHYLVYETGRALSSWNQSVLIWLIILSLIDHQSWFGWPDWAGVYFLLYLFSAGSHLYA